MALGMTRLGHELHVPPITAHLWLLYAVNRNITSYCKCAGADPNLMDVQRAMLRNEERFSLGGAAPRPVRRGSAAGIRAGK